MRAAAVPDEILIYLMTKAWDRLRLLGDEEEIAPGLNTFLTGGHHPESLAIRVQTAQKRVILSDSIFRYENL